MKRMKKLITEFKQEISRLIREKIKKIISRFFVDIYYESKTGIKYSDDYAIGFDIPCAETVTILPKEKVLIDLDLKLDLPDNYWVMLVPRSKLAKPDFPIILSNSVGIIDPNYKKIIKAGVWNISDKSFTINKDDVYFQGIIFKKVKSNLIPGLVEDTTKRGGFGSTDNQ